MDYQIRRPRYWKPTKLVDADEQAINIEKFKKKYARVWEMLEEVRQRCPWQRHMCNSLVSKIGRSAKLTDGQKSLVTSLYLENVVRSDADINKQKKYRKMVLQLKEASQANWGISAATRKFISSVATFSDSHTLTDRQISVIRNIAKEHTDLPDIDFDGWFSKGTI